MKNIFTLFACLAFTITGFSQAVYRTTGANTSFTNAASWTLFSGVDSDMDGIPDANDDVTILNGHTINTPAGKTVKSMTINNGGTFNGGGNFFGLKGDFTNNGTVSGIKLSFSGTSGTITSATPLAISSFISATSTVTIAAGTQVTCNTGSATAFQVLGASTINNNGTLICGALNNASFPSMAATFNNLSGGVLRMNVNLNNPFTLVSSNNSTINLLTGVTNLPNWTYHHLSLQGSGSTKTASATVNINGNLTNNNGVTFNLANNTLNLLGNLSNSGTISNLSTVTLNGTSNQTLTSSSTLTIPTLTSTNTNTIILNTGTYSLGSATSFVGNLTLNTATLNLNNNTLNLAKDLTNTGTISNISTINLNGSINQTLSTSAALTIPTLTCSNTNTIILNTGTYNLGNAVTFPGSLNLTTATLNLNSNTLNLAGNMTNAGTISNIQDVNFNGTGTQSISSNDLAIANLTCSNAAGVNITSGNHTITNSLAVSAGDLNAGANLITLVSDATKTAYIANSAGTISGSMIIQRFIPSRVASYAEFSSPVTSTTINDWDNELYMTINAPNDVPGFPGGDGLYGGPGEFWSVTEYNTATGTYDSILTGTTLNVGQGYNIWVADDDTQFPGRSLDTRGTPNMGTPSTMALLDSDPFFPGWNLIGNPHAAFIDWSDIVTANPGVSSYIQIYDGSGNYVDDASGPEIAPGQGFWVEVGSTMAINFPQSSKRTTTASTFFRSSTNANSDIKLRLSSNANPFYHEINLNFEDNSTIGFEKGKDITFLKSPKQIAPYIVFTDGTHKFIRNKMNTTSPLVVLPLEISTPIAGNYTIELEGLLSNGVYSEAYFINNNTKEKIEIGDANAITMYFEKGETNISYSLVLKKANVPFNFNGDDVSIFSTSDLINIKGNFETAQTVEVEVFNIVGQLVMNTTTELLPNDKITLSTTDLQSEVYLVKVTTSNNQQFTNKIVVTK